MSLLHAAILGLIEGLTEFLPVSSTAHLILAGRFLGLPETEFLKTFEIAIQLGAILAVVLLYWRRLLLDRRMFLLVCAAFVPTAIIGFVLHDFVKSVLLESVPTVLWALAVGGIVLAVYETLLPVASRDDAADKPITFPQAICIGVCQMLALIPGVSRSAATIVGGQLLGVKRAAIVEFSFLLAIPTMAAAVGLDLLKSLKTFHTPDVLPLAVGFLVAFGVALVSVKWFLDFIKTRSFRTFGFYRIGLALLCAVLLLR